jgi:glycosyltransferase involved in cell wall biosynthesis
LSVPAPRVSVVLPVRNRSQPLRRAIASVLAQTFAEFELIVVDDGSDEDLLAVIAAFGDGRITYLRRDHSEGPAVARNDGIRRARADLVAFQDSDDAWLPAKLERQVAALERAGTAVGLVCTGHYLEFAPDRFAPVAPWPHMGRDTFEPQLLANFGAIAPTWLARRSSLERSGLFDPALRSREDWELAMRLWSVCRFSAIPALLVVKYRSADSVDGNLSMHIDSLTRILDRHEDRFAQYPAVWARHLRELGLLQRLFADGASARRTLLRAARVAPPGVRALTMAVATLAGRPAFATALGAWRVLRRALPRRALLRLSEI